MTDQQDRRTEHGLRSPANDGAPRPRPPRELQEGISKGGPKERPTVQRPSRNPPSQKVMPEMLAAEDAAIEQAVLRRGELDGLRKAAKLVCYHCAHDWPLTTRQPFGWNHRGTTAFRCPSSAIHDEIARLERGIR